MSDRTSGMTVITNLAEYRPRPCPVLTIGNFDGLHHGHRQLLQAVVACASRQAGTAMVLTFDPHPLRVLSPSTPLRLLMPPDEKRVRLAEAGIQVVLSIPFDHAFAALTPDEFVRTVLCDRIAVRELFVGEQFGFGAKRAGRVSDLIRLGAACGFAVHAVAPVLVDGEVVSSTRIRTLVQAGRVKEAWACLGRPYELNGVVLHGDRRGHDLGWPTANVRLPGDRVIPADGVYATLTFWKDRAYESVAYIGTRPTFGAGERLLEVFLLDERVALYGEEIRVQFVDYLRPDRTFGGPEELSAQIGVDVAQARQSLKSLSMTASGA